MIMLLNAEREQHTLGSHVARAVGFPAVVAILAVVATVLLHVKGLGAASLGDGLTNAPNQTNLDQIASVLFHELLLPFEVTSVLILIAILGAVALARKSEPESTEERTAGK